MAASLELLSLPHFDGRTHAELTKGKDGTRAEVFLDRLTAYTATLTPPEGLQQVTGAQRVAATALQFTGRAAEWWHHLALDPYVLEIDTARITTEWDYFVSKFKARFYEVQSAADTVEDISDVKQKSDEKGEHYVERLMIMMNAITRFSRENLLQRITQDAVRDQMPADLRAHLQNPAGDAALGAAQLRAAVLTFAQQAAQHFVNESYRQHTFQQICRTVGRNASDEWIRTRAKKTFQQPGATLETLQTALKEERTAHRRLPNNARPISAVNNQDENDNGQDDAAEDVNALYGQRGGRGGGRGGRGGRGGGRGGRGRGGGRGGGAGRAPLDHSLYCKFCDVTGHSIDNCRTFARAKEYRQQTRGRGRGANNNNGNNGNGNNGNTAATNVQKDNTSANIQQSTSAVMANLQPAPTVMPPLMPNGGLNFTPAYSPLSGN